MLVRKKIFIVLLLSLQCISAYADTIDSVQRLRDSLNFLLNDTVLKVDIRLQKINDLSYELININSDIAIQYVNNAINLNKNTIKSPREFSNSFTILGIIHKNKGFYELSLSNYLEALKFAELSKDTARISVCLNNIGVIYNLNSNNKEAIKYYRNSIKLEDSNNKEQLSIRYYNLGEAFQNLQELDSSFFYFSNSLLLEELQNNKYGIAYAHYGLGNLMFDWKKFNKSADHLLLAEQMLDSISNYELESKVSIGIGKVYLMKGDLKISIEKLNKAYTIAKEYDYKSLEIEALENLINLYQISNDTKNLLIILQKLNALYKTQNEGDIDNKINTLQKLYTIEVKEREIEKLKSDEILKNIQLQHSKKVKNFLFGAMLIVIGIFAFNVYRLNKLRNKE